MIKCLCLVFTLFAFSSSAQSTFDQNIDFLPTTPNAASMINYGMTAINKNTGNLTLDIPIFSIKEKDISTSLSLGYNSTAIKVDQIASRAGMGWALNMGGVITRTVMGKVDELNHRHYPYAEIERNWGTLMYMNRISTSNEINGYDAEPDIFHYSFSGYNGSFFFKDDDLIPVEINKSGLKIESNIRQSETWSFKITTPDGIVYFFGGPDATESSKSKSTCGKTYNRFIPTAWYLTNILSTSGQSIFFQYKEFEYEYDNGFSEISYPDANGACINASFDRCVNIRSVQGGILTSIIGGESRVNLTYINRPDCKDKLVSTISILKNNQLFKQFIIDYAFIAVSNNFNKVQYYAGQNYTPYLSSLIEQSNTETNSQRHYFSYYEPNLRPHRLSYCQDHWGNFNGKNNTCMAPILDNPSVYFPLSTANRQPDITYAKRGLLKKIIYPTGGISMFNYEANVYNEPSPQYYTTPHKIDANVTGIDASTEKSKIINFNIGYSQEVTLNYSMTGVQLNQAPGRVLIEGVDIGGVNYTYAISPEDPPQVRTIYLYPGEYKMTIFAKGASQTTYAVLKHKSPKHQSSASEIEVGGVRISEIMTSDLQTEPTIKKYKYSALNENISSMGYTLTQPAYQGYKYCIITAPTNARITQPMIYSSSLINLYPYNSNNVSYGKVVESFGANFQGGAIETEYFIQPDAPGQIVFGGSILNAPFSNLSSIRHGKIISESEYAKDQNDQLILKRKKEFTYHLESFEDYYGFFIANHFGLSNLNVDSTCNLSSSICNQFFNSLLDNYDMNRYTILSSWVHPNTETETIYDDNGYASTKTKSYRFENSINYLVTEVETVNSKGEQIIEKIKYPNDFLQLPIYQSMVQKNMINSIIVKSTSKMESDGSIQPLATNKINYGNTTSGIKPISFESSKGDFPLHIDGTISKYDNKGNVIETVSSTGIVTSYLWGYKQRYLIAKIEGKTIEFVYNLFDDTQRASLNELDGQPLLDELEIIRTVPNIQITMYTYKPGIGVDCIVDANKLKTTYVYDDYGRLILVRDNDNNILKKISYQIASPNPETSKPIYFNAELNQDFLCNKCMQNYNTTTPITYTVPAGKYISLISQVDANDKATLEISQKGQENANKLSTCINVGLE